VTKRILVIEDEKAIREAILDMLEAEGFQAIGADNGRAGVRLAQEHFPDLILCDIMMPDLDGYGVLAELRRDPIWVTIPFIFLTARAERFDMRLGMELGADDYLTKPFTREEVLRTINVRLAKHTTVIRRFEQQMDALRGNIALSLPHELRTPLSGILTGTEILSSSLDTLDRKDIEDIVGIIRQSAERLNRLIANYLMYAELEFVDRDPALLQSMQTDLVLSTRRVITAAAALAAQRAKRPKDLVEAHQDATARIMEGHLAKIVEELVDNAFKYSPPGTPVRVASQMDSGEFRLSVSDGGRGMTSEQIASVGAYMQFDRKLHEQQGSGLGLAIARRLVHLYQGSLVIQSQPGQGTTVLVTLPA